jgi:hypothetical protein
MTKKIEVHEQLIRAVMMVTARRFEAPIGTRLRAALEVLVEEMDAWAGLAEIVQRRNQQRGNHGQNHRS